MNIDLGAPKPIDQYIPIFVDAKPSENLDPSAKQTLCFVAILTSNMNGVPKLKGYKNTKRAMKIESARKIVKHLSERKLELDAIGIAGKTQGQHIIWACETINRARDLIGASWEVDDTTPTHLIWNDNRIDISTVLGLSIYASLMPILALRAACVSNHDPTRKYKFCLDALPNNSLLGMELMRELSRESEIAVMWDENLEMCSSFEIGTLDKWLGDDNKWHPGKKHPNSILVDWMAVGCMAKVDPKQLIAEGGYSIEEIKELARIWEAAITKSIINLDDKDYMDKVKNHWETTKKGNDSKHT